MSDIDLSEKIVAERAAILLKNALTNEIGGFKKHYRKGSKSDNDPSRKPLSKFKVKIGSKLFKKEDGSQKYYFNSLSLDIGKHAFIQNSGAATIRSGSEVEKPGFKTYYRNYHEYHLPKTNFLGNAIHNSGVVPYVAKEISKERGYAVLNEMIQEMANRLNTAKNGRFYE